MLAANQNQKFHQGSIQNTFELRPIHTAKKENPFLKPKCGRRFAPTAFLLRKPFLKNCGIHCTKFEPFSKAIPNELHPATICLGQRRRGDGLARAEEGSGEESARASAFFFEKIGGY